MNSDLPVDLNYWMYPDAFMIWRGAWWGLITSALVHLEALHLCFNVYWLWYLGSRLEFVLGRHYYALLMIISALVTSSIQLAASGETGIGISGVVYTLFGFTLVARIRYPRLAEAVTPPVIFSMLVCLGVSVVLAYAGKWNVGNAAHISGTLLGAAIAAAFSDRPMRGIRLTGVIASTAMVAAAAIPLFWCPGTRRGQ